MIYERIYTNYFIPKVKINIIGKAIHKILLLLFFSFLYKIF